MKFLVSIAVVTAIFLTTPSTWADLQIGQSAPQLKLEGKQGGRLDGSIFNSLEFKDKVTVLFYVDPDEKDLNNQASEALKEEKFPQDRYQSYGIINMAATWLPNFAISSSLKKKQEKYPSTIYVRDYKKALVNQWGLADDSSCVLAFDKEGQLIFRKDGLLTNQEIKTLIQAIRQNLDK